LKILIAILAFAVALAMPAFSQSKTKKPDPNAWWQAPNTWQAPAARRQAPPDSWSRSTQTKRPRSPNPAWDVYYNDGRYAGSDPDPSIRTKLFFDDPNSDS
jgi:hypothetical protein